MFGWFDFAWPWVGLGFAVTLVVLLSTNVLRSDRTVARWRDLRWLSFLAVAVYLLHNVEEYGLAANGLPHAFPDALCEVLGQPSFPACAIPPSFFLAVNIPLVWIAGPLAAVLSRKFTLAGLTLWGVIGVNSAVHLVPAVAQNEYNPGLFTAALLFIPLTVVCAVATSGPHAPYRPAALLVLFVSGLIMHAVLIGTAILYLHGSLPQWLFLLAQPAVVVAGFVLVGLSDSVLRRRSPVEAAQQGKARGPQG